MFTSLRASVALYLSLFTTIFLVGFLELQGQGNSDIDPCSGGTLYYVAFPDTVRNAQDSRFADRRRSDLLLFIYSPVNQQVEISYANDTSVSKNVAAGEFLEFNASEFNKTKVVRLPFVTRRNSPQSTLLKVESESPVVLYAYMATPFGCAAFTPIPVESWGTEYVAATWEGNYVRDIQPAGELNFDASNIIPAPAQILVIAAYDETEVRITPTDTLASCDSCKSVRLNKGEAYLVQSFVQIDDKNYEIDVQPDIAGTLISANKPIGVVTGNTRLWHERFTDSYLAGNPYKDFVAEWLAPVEQHGKEFVFLPTWDRLRQPLNGNPIRQNEYVRIYATTNELTDISGYSGNDDSLDAPKPEDGVMLKGGAYWHARLSDLTRGVYYQTTAPAQAYQSPRPVSMYNGTTGSGSFIGAQYKAWGTYMVEMVPREQWVTSAPVIAPSYPVGMDHYITLVADSADQSSIYYRAAGGESLLFPLTEGKIRGGGRTFVWGSLKINSGKQYNIEGRGGAKFGGYVFGSLEGLELYRPGVTKKKETKGESTQSLHPSEFEEEVAMMYGYPLAPSRCLLDQSTSYDVQTEMDCGKMTVTIRAIDSNGSGLKFVQLVKDPLVTSNLRLEFVEPADPALIGTQKVTTVHLRLVPIDPLQDARGVLEFKDRTQGGAVERVNYSYTADRLEPAPENVDFGSLTVNTTSEEEVVILTNPLDRDVTVKQLRFAFGNRGFAITRTEPAFDWKNGNDPLLLKSGESLKVWVTARPKEENQVYQDSLRVVLTCLSISVPLEVTSAQPCLYVPDLDFGTLRINESKTLPLEICNTGKGRVTFHDSTATGGGAFLTWLSSEFEVSAEDILKLRNASLGPGECITINVTFESRELVGIFRTTARFWSNTRSCRDTSIWNVRVSVPGAQISGYNWGERWLSSRNACTKNPEEGYQTNIEVSNDGDAPYTVVGLKVVDSPNGVFEILNPGNVVPNKIINPGMKEKVLVVFRPVEQKTYSGRIRLYYSKGGALDSIDNTFDGIGIESCLQVNDIALYYDTTSSVGSTTTRSVQFRSTGTKPVTITGIYLVGSDASEFDLQNPPSIPFTIPPGEKQDITVKFSPSRNRSNDRHASLAILGNFAYVDCPGSCSDSLAELTGKLGTLTVAGEESLAGYAINRVMPNPFSDELEISFSLGKAGETSVVLYDAAGVLVQELLREELRSGLHTIRWSEKIPSGLYYLQITSGNWSGLRKVWSVK
ncbi:MAG: choice-of-anchor D domain-containing protein [Ignavibacteriae bacterium]|nr:choice-of-anchor D domain-containing protein [Ignavibacteriota bacterium]MCB9215024.1 choice-of-anchor D domain-containing protein [Ignavibacteria bacterium]